MDEAESEVLLVYMSVPGLGLVGERPLSGPHRVSMSDLEKMACCYCVYQYLLQIQMNSS